MNQTVSVTVRLMGTGSYLPERVVTNDEIAPGMGSNDEWIVSHTGIKSRHFASNDESSSSLGVKAGERALAAAGVKPEEIGLVLCATSSPDYNNFPSNACLIQAKLGCTNAGAFDLAAACSGFVYGLEMARCYLACHPESKVLVIGSEVLSRCVDWKERTVSMLFGDGAGAVVLAAAPEAEPTPGATVLGSDGTGGEFITLDGGRRQPLAEDIAATTVREMEVGYMKMQGRAVFNFAVKKLDEIVRTLCDKAGITVDELDLVVPHQANIRILEAVARRMELPNEKIYANLETIGNTSSASIPLCLDKAVREGTIKDGMKVALAGFGAGLTWAGAYLRWPYL